MIESNKPKNAAKSQSAKPVSTSNTLKPGAKTVSKSSSTSSPAAKKPVAPAAAKKPVQTKPAQVVSKPSSAVNKTTATASKASSSTKPSTAASKVTSPASKVSTSTTTSAKPATKTVAKAKTVSKTSKAQGKTNSSAKKKKIIIAGVAIFLVIAIVIGVIIGTLPKKNNNGDNNDNNSQIIIPAPDRGVYNPSGDLKPKDPYQEISFGEETYFSEDEIVKYPYDIENGSTTTAVGYDGKQIGTVERSIPEKTRDEGLGVYPKFGYTLSTVIGSEPDKIAARDALIAESNYLCATGTRNNSGNGGGYIWMDENGYLYNGTTAQPIPALDKYEKHRRIYKHSASAGLYMGDVSEDEPGIIKQVTIRPRGYGSYSVTGVYAPAGEIIKIQISEADMNATGGLTIHIGQALYNGQANNIWTAKGQMQRFPIILNTMNVNKNTATLEDGVYTAYVGSFVGGPLYIRNTNATYTATISGGVAYSHFILGKTTKEEFEANKKSSAPYFDMEVWNYGVLHSGPKLYAQNFSYEDLYKAAVLWEKVASVTTTGSNQGIVFLYEPFVAAGAAVAFPGRSSVNCPASWMSSSLNYNSMVTSGAWGNFHEYHHNFQGYGVGNGGEVTNNGMTLVSYALFTKISAARGISSYGAAGLGGWNSYTSATWALTDLLKIAQGGSPSNGKQGLAIYATLLHNFGADNYIQAKVRQRSKSYGENYSGYLRAWQDITHNDMTYFFKDVLQGIDEATAEKWKPTEDYPVFVPVSSVYQTGRSFMYDGKKEYFKTMQPYVIPYGEEFNIDLSKYNAPGGQYASGSVVLPEGFTYTIKNISSPASGTIERVDYFNFKYKPGKDNFSGKIIVTLEITKTDGAFEVDDVDLVLEFEQSHETNKTTLTRTTYNYSAESMYTDAQAAYENNFAGHSSVNTIAHSNPTQNCNTDIWFYADTPENHEKFPNAPAHYFVTENSIAVIKGKLYFNEAGKYRIYLRGRMNCALYYSIDGGNTYNLGATIKDTNVINNSHLFRPSDDSTYFDITLEEHSWIVFKEVLIVGSTPTISYIGLGTAKWTEPMFTQVTKYYDAQGNEVDSPEDAVRTEIHYYDYQGNEVSEEEANRAELMPPSSTAQPSYVNAYREDYEFPSNSGFESDYFYTRNYTYTYSNVYKNLNQSSVGESTCPDNFPIENLFDDSLTTVCSSKNLVSENAPWIITVDLGQEIYANKMTLTGILFNGAGNKNQTPKSFTLYLGETADNLVEVKRVENGAVSGVTIAVDFELTTFRYYRLVVTRTVEGRFGAIANISFSNNISNGKQYTPDNDMFTYSGNWSGMQTYSTFGHVYIGKPNATMSFEFVGTRLALLSAFAYGDNFEVYIDGVKVNSIDLKKTDDSYGASYISQELSSGNHNVVVKCLSTASIDSVVIFQ